VVTEVGQRKKKERNNEMLLGHTHSSSAQSTLVINGWRGIEDQQQQ